jgi:hypothetical protein
MWYPGRERMRICRECRSARRLLVEGTENHIKNGLLTGFEFVEYRQTGSHGEMIVKVIGVMTGKEDDSVFVQAYFRGVLKELGSVQMGHFQVDDHQVQIVPYRLQSLQRILTGLHIQTRIIMLYIGTEEEKKGFVIINYQYLAHSHLILPGQTPSVTHW